jgi:hypothetical protein
VTELTDLIVYATPVGPLAADLATYLDEVRVRVGPNRAHDYPPHCTLTGFFHDLPGAVPSYESALERALAAVALPSPVVEIRGLRIEPAWHGLELTAPALAAVVAGFVRRAASGTRVDALRPKSWLHLSLAYEFDERDAARLAELARALVDPARPVAWELGLWERAGAAWHCHWRRPLADGAAAVDAPDRADDDGVVRSTG